MTEKVKARLVCLHMANNNLLDDITLLPEAVYTVGRDNDSSIVLRLDEVSNKHAEFGFGDDGWTIIDCGSTNGVYVNGRKTSFQKLKHGDEIQLGSALFCFQEVDRKNIHSKTRMMAFGLFLVGIVGAAVFLFDLYARKQQDVNNVPETFENRNSATTPNIPDVKPDERKTSKIKKYSHIETPRITGQALVHVRSTELKVYYNAKNENVLILDFPTLHQHGLMFNRMLAFAEGPGVSRNAILNDHELLSFLKNKKMTFETFAFGNDFVVKDIVDFFNLANQNSVKLNEEEIRLKKILLEHEFMVMKDDGMFKATPDDKAVISTTQIQPDDPSTDVDERIDIGIRRALLIHELSHGEFFTNKAYRVYCKTFWDYQMSEIEKQAFKKMLLENNYDILNETLCINEMQAYLMNTPDKRFFSAKSLGLTEDELQNLQKKFMWWNPPTELYRDAQSYE